VDVAWSIVVGILAIGGIIICAHYQGNIRSAGMRLALIIGAICLGAGGGLLADRLTASRRSSRRSGANRKSRRQIRSVAFAITGIVVASTILGLYLAHQVWIIIGAGVGVLAATWLWYILECRQLSQGTPPGRLGPRDH
jgi:hypothetical protein